MKTKWESWKQRIGDDECGKLWDRTAYDRIWLNIGDEKAEDMETDTVGTDANTVSTNNDTASDQQKVTFQSLSPGAKYKLITLISKPQNITYNKDRTVSIQVNRQEANQILQETQIVNYKVSITKHPHRNNIRGIISKEVLRESPADEIKEGLASENCVHVRKEMQPKRDHSDKIVRDKDGKVVLEPKKSAVITLECESLPREVTLFGVDMYGKI